MSSVGKERAAQSVLAEKCHPQCLEMDVPPFLEGITWGGGKHSTGDARVLLKTL